MTITATDAGTNTLNTRTADPTAPPWRPFRVIVARMSKLSPTFLRITFTGDDLDQFGHDGPDQRIKLYIPRPGQGIPDLSPTEWYQEYRASDPAVRGFIRTYTIRAVRPHLRELDVDFVMHGHGEHGSFSPAATWATNASIGDEIAIIGPNRVFAGDCRGHEWNPPLDARDVLIAGDETAVPAIAGILDTMRLAEQGSGLHTGNHATGNQRTGKAPRTQVFLEVPEPADALHLSVPGHAEVTWLPRQRPNGSMAQHGELLVDAVRSAAFDASGRVDDTSAVDTVDIDLQVLWEVAASASSSVYAWVAGEAGAVKTIRRHLVRDRGIDKSAVTFMGYWRLGRSLDD